MQNAPSRTLLLLMFTAGAVWSLSAGAAAAQPPLTPTGVQVVQVGSTLRITWTGVPSENNGYIVTFHAGTAATNSSATRVGTLTPGLVTSLDVPIPPGVQGTYNVVVAAISSPGASPATEFTIASGGTGCSGPPPAPTGLTGSRVLRTANIRFNQAAGATSYVIHAGTGQGLSNVFVGNIGNATSAGSDSVDPAIQLFVRVFGVNSCGTSPPTPDLNLIAGGAPVCVPDAQTMCLFNGRFVANLTVLPTASAFVTRRFNDGGGFNFSTPSGADDLFLRVQDRCAAEGRFVVVFTNSSGFPSSTGFELFLGDTVASVSRRYVHAAGTQFSQFQDAQSFTCQ